MSTKEIFAELYNRSRKKMRRKAGIIEHPVSALLNSVRALMMRSD